MRLRASRFAAPISVFAALALVMLACVGDDPETTTPRDDAGSAVDAASGTDGAVGDGGSSNDSGAGDDGGESVPPHVPVVDSYFKATHPRVSAAFGSSVAISADGTTLAVGSPGEDSSATGVNNSNPGPADTNADSSGAVFVFVRSGAGVWTQQAYIKPHMTAANMRFGESISLSSDGNRLAVGAKGESSGAASSGAVYTFERNGGSWIQSPSSVSIKASNIMAQASFGSAVALSGDGLLLAVAAFNESATDTGVSTGNGGASTGTTVFNGAVYVYARSGADWVKTHYIKPSIMQTGARFGWSIALSGTSGDGAVLAVGSIGDPSSATGVSASMSSDTSAASSGATFLFEKSGGGWNQVAYVKASNTRPNARFGSSLALSADGKTLAVGSELETSGATGVNATSPGPEDTTAGGSGAAYVFTRTAGGWSQTAYVKASNTRSNAAFGRSIDLSLDGKSLIVGSTAETSAASGVNNTTPGQGDTSVANSGAAYVYALVNGAWSQTAYLKSFTSTTYSSNFGAGVAITNGAATVAVGGSTEPTTNAGINQSGGATSAGGSGAAFTFK